MRLRSENLREILILRENQNKEKALLFCKHFFCYGSSQQEF